MSEASNQQDAGCVSYAADIRPKFTDEDVDHMNDMVGMNLASYETVRDNADDILRRLQSTTRPMPPRPRGPWPLDWITCFEHWIAGGKQP